MLRTLRVLAQELFVEGVEVSIRRRGPEVLLDGLGNRVGQRLVQLVDWKN